MPYVRRILHLSCPLFKNIFLFKFLRRCSALLTGNPLDWLPCHWLTNSRLAWRDGSKQRADLFSVPASIPRNLLILHPSQKVQPATTVNPFIQFSFSFRRTCPNPLLLGTQEQQFRQGLYHLLERIGILRIAILRAMDRPVSGWTTSATEAGRSENVMHLMRWRVLADDPLPPTFRDELLREAHRRREQARKQSTSWARSALPPCASYDGWASLRL